METVLKQGYSVTSGVERGGEGEGAEWILTPLKSNTATPVLDSPLAKEMDPFLPSLTFLQMTMMMTTVMATQMTPGIRM